MRLISRNKCVSQSAVRSALAAALFLLGPWVNIHSHAQLLHPDGGASPSFEVASIRPSHTESASTNYNLSNARFHAENATLTDLIRFGYDIKSDDQLPKDPGWIASEKFDVDAKVDDPEVEAMGKLLPDQKLEHYRLMVRSLLEDRFKLRVSTHTKELPVHALVVAPGGPRLTPARFAPNAATKRMPTLGGWSRGDLRATDVSMMLFSDQLSGRDDSGNRVVIDATGLNGVYDFTLSWTPENIHAAQLSAASAGQEPANASTADTSKPSIFTALQEQLGLKLESRKAPVDVLVIDHVEQPSPN